MVWNYQNADCSERKKNYSAIYYNFGTFSFPCCPTPVSPIYFATFLFVPPLNLASHGAQRKVTKIVAKVAGDQIHLIRIISRVEGDASHRSHIGWLRLWAERRWVSQCNRTLMKTLYKEMLTIVIQLFWQDGEWGNTSHYTNQHILYLIRCRRLAAVMLWPVLVSSCFRS